MLEFQPGKVREVLEGLFYSPIQDCGKFYRTCAAYRGGSNSTSLSVNKLTGWCKDFVNQEKFPLSKLVEKTLNTRDPRVISKYINCQVSAETKKEPQKIIMPRTYDASMLQKLFPNYEFYKRRGISEQTQKQYQVGLAHSGQMLRRFVFPVWDESEQIIGFSGRSLDWKEDSTFPKWKHIGKKNEWIYPYYCPKLPEVREEIDSGGAIFIVESIGDSMALSEHGVFNHCVNFGLGCSPAMQSFLLSKMPERIVVSTNQDSHKENEQEGNSGKITAVKTLIKLSSFFPMEKLAIKLPTLNDLGEMHQSGIDIKKWSWTEKNGGGKEMSRGEIKEYIAENKRHFQTQNMEKFLKKL